MLANAATIPRSEKVVGRADCLSGDTVGDLVYITGAKVGNRFQVAKADPTSGAVPAVGSILKKLSATECIVQFHGPVKNVYTGLSPGVAYFLGTNGRPAAAGDGTFPDLSAHDAVQQVGVATDDSELLLDLEGADGVTEAQHEVLDTLTHGLAEDAFTELSYVGKILDSVIVWASAAKVLKIRESALTYTDKDLTGVVVKQYDSTGSLLVTLTKTLAYGGVSGKDLVSVTVVRT